MALIAPSVLTADWLGLRDELRRAAGADVWHLDVMDGHFVPNLTFGPSIVAAIAREVSQPVECHLMVLRPEDLLPRYVEAGASRLIVHAEATGHLHRLLQSAHDLGVEAGVAINPATPLSVVEEVAGDADCLLIMTVNPGFGGQTLIESQLDKVRRARERFPTLQIIVDGGVTVENAGRIAASGADELVTGSSVFHAGADPAQEIARLRSAAAIGETPR